MSNIDRFYDMNPVGVIDQNSWTEHDPEVNLAFHHTALYTPLIDWDNHMAQTGAMTYIEHELMEGDVNYNPIALTANYIDSQGLDSRYRTFTAQRYGGKVQLHESSNIFNQWKISGNRDWRPLLRGVLGDHVVRLNEKLARNVWFAGPKTFWTYSGGGTDFSTLDTTKKFDLAIVNEWNLRVGQHGAPIIPGDMAPLKLAIVPPGAIYDIRKALPAASGNETALWRDAYLHAVEGPDRTILNYEVGAYKGCRFQQAPNDKFGINPNVLYNAGAVTKQWAVTQPIKMGDGAPDPSITAVDGVWHIGQQNVTHFIQMELSMANTDYAINDWVTIHVKQSAAYGIASGVDPFDGLTIVRRVVAIDTVGKTLSFDRPISINYTAQFAGKSLTGNTAGAFYAYVTKGLHVGFALVLGSRGGVAGKVARPLKFYEPKPVDDFDSVWRFSYDQVVGYNLAEPHMYELYFFNVSLPKPGGIG